MKNITTFFWDMDGVKYPLTQKAYGAFWTASYKAIQYFMPGMDDEASLKMAQYSWKEYHSGTDALFREHGFEARTVQNVFHQHIDENAMEAPSPAYHQFMTSNRFKHCLLTHGNHDWASRLITKIGAAEYFNKNNMVCLEDIWPHLKPHSPEPFKIALQKISAIAENSLMIEDSRENLFYAKELGMTTALIELGTKPKPDYIDYHFQDLNGFLNHLKLAL